MKHSKGNTMAIIVLLVLALSFTGCGYKIVKKSPEPTADKPAASELVVKTGKSRTNMVILQELLSNGDIIDKDVYSHSWLVPNGTSYDEVTYTWEMWVIQTGEDFHAAIFEYGRLVDIEPVKSLEHARSAFKPYGGWR